MCGLPGSRRESVSESTSRKFVLPDLWMVFDCESIGLHGETFAVGYVVVDSKGKEYARSCWACYPDEAKGNEEGRLWVKANIPPLERNRTGPKYVRDSFWNVYLYWRDNGAVLCADCAWPVEARFLATCIDDDPSARTWNGPYPLYDLASIRLAAGFDPLATEDRLPHELPVHNPLADALQSARLLIESLTVINELRYWWDNE
jgi:hypothetical protein